jgi:hypothetical protein
MKKIINEVALRNNVKVMNILNDDDRIIIETILETIEIKNYDGRNAAFVWSADENKPIPTNISKFCFDVENELNKKMWNKNHNADVRNCNK